MAELIAQGPRREQRWRRRIPERQVVSIGRLGVTWVVPWDEHISRRHIEVQWDGQALHVRSLPQTRNPIFLKGSIVTSFHLQPGEHFVIGGTTFTLTDGELSLVDHFRPPLTEQTFSADYLRHLRFHDPSDRLDIISRLPEQFTMAVNDADLYEEVVRVIFSGVDRAAAVGVCELQHGEIAFLRWDSSETGVVDASQRLIAESFKTGQSIVHTWDQKEVAVGGDADSGEPFTANEGCEWAFAIPFGDVAGSSRKALYVAGHGKPGDSGTPRFDLRDELKFAQIVTATASTIRESVALRRRQSTLGQFFSAPVIRAIELGNAEETLMPREVDVTVLFCDLRGFSRATEQFANDLPGLLQRVSDALGVLTKWILHEGGVIGDFHGDAAMGFWGWPLPQSDAALRAARSALAMFEEFSVAATGTDNSLREFRIGVGIASGRVVAGKIGTVDQVKVTAFGPAVNLASRLEGMTKRLNAPILLDAATAAIVRSEANDMRLRKLAVVKPYGMQSAIEIHQLVPPADRYPLLTDEHIEHYERALAAFIAGDWNLAWEELHHVPAADPSKDFLTTWIASRSRTPPEQWDGVIRLDAK